MTYLLYDSSFNGFLTAVFEAYDRKLFDYRIRKEENYVSDIFGDTITIVTDAKKSARVLKGLKQKITNTGFDYLYCASFSELPEAEALMQSFVQRIFNGDQNVESDFSDLNILQLARISKSVHRERHRMKAFIRFQLTGDGIYYACIEPDFNVIPLIITHFKNRYADQRWLIYDLKRKYGIYYDLEKVETVTLTFSPATHNGKNIGMVWDEKELLYQQLWQNYFKSANIATRKNMSLHIKHVPKRYWKLLTEKGVDNII